MKIFTFSKNYCARVIVLLFIAILSSNIVLADYTVPAGTTVNATELVGKTGVLIINGTVNLNSNVVLANITEVIINGPTGNINWTNNSDLTFPDAITFVVNNLSSPNTSGGLQPTAGNGNAAQRLYIGTILIAVSSDNSNVAQYSFEQFNSQGGLPSITGNLSVCVDFTTTLTGSGTKNDTSPWVSESPSIATVNSSGLVTGISPGTAIIIYTNKYGGSIKATITVLGGATIVSPSNSNQTVCLSTSIAPMTFTIGGSGKGATVSGLPGGLSGSYNSGSFTISGTPTITGVFDFIITTSGGCSQSSVSGKITVVSGYVWTGAGSDALWTTPANWSACGIPSPGANVTIPDMAKDPVLASHVQIGDLDLQGSASIDLADFTLTLGSSTSNIIKNSGFFKGNSSSRLLINGTLSTSLKFDPSCNFLKDLVINTAGKTITLGNSLEVSGLVEVKAGILESTTTGFLTLLSSQNSYGQIGILSGSASVTGNVNVQSYISGGSSSHRGSRMMASPVADNFSSTVYQQLKEKMFITGPQSSTTGTVNGFDLGGWAQPYAVTMTTYSEPNNSINSFVPVPTITTRVIPGQATFLFFRGDRTTSPYSKLNAPYATPEYVTANYKGTINQGTVSIEISKTVLDASDVNNGMNAIGNPYPATIDWETVYATNSAVVENEIRINRVGGGFVTKSSLGVVPVDYESTVQYIQPGQGFYVKKKQAGTAPFTFLETHKAVSKAAARFLHSPELNKLASNSENLHLVKDSKTLRQLRVNIRQGELIDETLIVFQDGFSNAFDNNDAAYFAGNTVLVGSMSSDGKVTSINAMPDVKDVEELKLYVSANTNGAYTLNFTDLSAGQGYQVFLKDALFPDKLVDLHQQTSYDFSIERMNIATYGSSRFSVIFKPELVAPPVSFTAEKIKSNVELNWATEAAQKINYFEVEVSEDKVSFTNIGQVANAGKDTKVQYSFVDKSPSGAIRYYRLKQFNANGSITFTDPRKIDLSNGRDGIASINVYPNPTTDKIQVSLNQKADAGVQAVIFNVQGQKMKTNLFSANQAVEMLVNEFPGGVYLLELRNQATTELIGQSKFVVSR